MAEPVLNYFKAFIDMTGKLPDFIRMGQRSAATELGQAIMREAVTLGVEVILEGTTPN